MMMRWEYIAGFFDGEGCVNTTTRKVEGTQCVTVTIAQSNADGVEKPPAVLLEISAFLSEVGIVHNISGGRKYLRQTTTSDGRKINTTRPIYNLQIQNRHGIIAFLTGVRPFLRVKKTKSEDVLRFFKMYPDMRGRFSMKKQENLSSEMVKADIAAGLTWEQTAEKHGCSITTIARRLNPEGYRKKMRNYRAKKAAESMSAQGVM